MARADEPASSGTPRTISISDPLPYGQAPVDYQGAATDDAVAQLQARIERGKSTLAFDGRHGYLPSLLAALDVPVESQALVFSRTALNPRLVGPANPRAVYFNEDVYVGWVPGAAAIELAAINSVKGAIFYTLPQTAERPPRFRREQSCLACHAGTSTLHVPGLIVRSFSTDEDGRPLAGYSRVTHETELEKRFGGWYVTGANERLVHRGNVAGESEAVGFDAASYLSPHSDVAAQLTLHHQAHGQNLLIRVGYEARLNVRSDAEEQLLRYLLFADEAPLGDAVRAGSPFAAWWESRGSSPLELRTRLLRRRVSWLVDSRLFAALPEEVKSRLRRGLEEARMSKSE